MAKANYSKIIEVMHPVCCGRLCKIKAGLFMFCTNITFCSRRSEAAPLQFQFIDIFIFIKPITSI